MITVIMPTRNNYQEVQNTLDSLFEHSPDVRVIIVNDYSEQWQEPRADERLTVLHNTPPEYGIVMSLNKAVRAAGTEKLFFCNARCRFTDGWDKVMEEALDKDPLKIYSCVSARLSEDQTDVTRAPRYYGAVCQRHDPKWHYKWFAYYGITNKKNIHEANTYLGGVGFTRAWWKHLRGVDGLLFRGMVNPFFSLKSWLAGGKVEVLQDCVVGNIYRKHTSYPVPMYAWVYNPVYMAYVFWGNQRGTEVMETFRAHRQYRYVKHLIVNKLGEISRYRRYLKLIKVEQLKLK